MKVNKNAKLRLAMIITVVMCSSTFPCRVNPKTDT